MNTSDTIFSSIFPLYIDGYRIRDEEILVRSMSTSRQGGPTQIGLKSEIHPRSGDVPRGRREREGERGRERERERETPTQVGPHTTVPSFVGHCMGMSCSTDTKYTVLYTSWRCPAACRIANGPCNFMAEADCVRLE